MRKNKLLVILSAVTMTAVSSVPVLSSAIAVFPNKVGTLEDFADSLDPEKNIVFFYDDGINQEKMYVLGYDGKSCVYMQDKQMRVTLKDGTTLDKNDIFDKLAKEANLGSLYSVSGRFEKIDENMYFIDVWSASFTDEDIINVLKQYDNVVSVDYCMAIGSNHLCDLEGIFVKSDLTDEEIESRYPFFKADHIDDEYRKQYNIYSDSIYFKYIREDSSNRFNIVKVVQEDADISLITVDFTFAESINDSCEAIGKPIENLYTAVIKGDVNSDGKVDIADVVAVASYAGDSESNSFKSEQQIINGDVHNKGDGLTANDALMIQQYLSRIIDSLE